MYIYIDRHSQDPILDRESEINDLVTFADEAKLDDVMVFSLEENLNTGHLTEQEQTVYIDMMTDIKKALNRHGVTFSINPWATILHRDDGAHLKEGQNFRLMKDVEGREAHAVCCPLCENWRKYVTNMFARFAKELQPRYIWVEDDFRFHNHWPLKWGGCFCDEHMKLFSEKAGKPLTREEFVAAIVKPGTPHPYRKIWLDSCRETTLENARLIADAVHAVSPETKVSLMSSAPQVHCAEGRDWHTLLKTLGGGHRIHLPAYSEIRPADYLQNFNRVSMMVRAMTDDSVETLPEMESAPWSIYNKSKAFTVFQLYSSLAMNVKGITMNIFDMIGTGAQPQDGFQTALAAVKPILSDLNGTGAFTGKKTGVKVLFSDLSSYTIHTKKGEDMTELYPDESWWAGVLSNCGIPYAYTKDIALENETVAVSGQVLRNFTEAQIRALFANNRVLVNADALQTLMDLGLSDIVHVKSVKWLDSEKGECAYEKLTTPVFGKKESRASTGSGVSGSGQGVMIVEYTQPVEDLSTMHNAVHEYLGHGMTLVDGKTVVFPFNAFAPWLVLSVRAELVRRTVHNLDRALPIVENCPYLAPYMYEDGKGGYYLYLLNASMDDYDAVQLLNAFGKVQLRENGAWKDIPAENGTLPLDARHMTGLLLHVEV